VTAGLIKAAVANRRNGPQVMRLLLESANDVVITDDMLKLMARNRESGKEILAIVLLQSDVRITDDAIIASMEGYHPLFDDNMLQLCLKRKGDDITFTEKLIVAFVKSNSKGERPFRHNLRRNGLKMSEDIVKGAAGDIRY